MQITSLAILFMSCTMQIAWLARHTVSAVNGGETFPELSGKVLVYPPLRGCVKSILHTQMNAVLLRNICYSDDTGFTGAFLETVKLQ